MSSSAKIFHSIHMRDVSRFCLRIVLPSLAIVLLWLFAASIAAASNGAVYVKVREAKLLSKARFIAPVIAQVRHGDRLDLERQDGSWLAVRTFSGKSGFVHASAVTERRVVLDSGAAFDNKGGGDSTVILAGKGFNKAVERAYASRNRSLNFKAVDAMEKQSVSSAALLQFAKEGRLAGVTP